MTQVFISWGSYVFYITIQAAAGPLQVSAGVKGGAEAAIHAMKLIFDREGTDAVILVDAANAFNRLNRAAALHNMPTLRNDSHQHVSHPNKAIYHRRR